MARFIGTPEEFYDLFGSNLLTKAVQTYTDGYRRMHGKCEHKGEGGIECSKILHAAHIEHTSRKSITMDILRPKCDENGVVDINIEEFLSDFYKAHTPLHEHFKILCSKHHGMYDAGKRESNFDTGKDTIYGMPKKELIAEYRHSSQMVEYVPNMEDVIAGLKDSGKCWLHYYMADGSVVSKEWNNTRAEITADNILSNVVSKTFFRDYRDYIDKVVVSLAKESK